MAIIGGVSTAPEFLFLFEGLGVNLLSNIIDRVARGERIEDEKLQLDVEAAIRASGIENLLTKNDFNRALSKLIRNQDIILGSIRGNEFELEQLANQLAKLSQLVEQATCQIPIEEKVLQGQRPIWQEVPQISGFIERRTELETINTALIEKHRVFVYGISGIGKTTLLSALFQRLNLEAPTVCWIGLNYYLAIEDIQHILSSFFSDLGLHDLAHSIANADRVDLGMRIIQALEAAKIYIIFDSLNSANTAVSNFIEELFSKSLTANLNGGILISSTFLPDCISPIDVLKNNVAVKALDGFTLEETEIALNTSNVPFTAEQVFDLYEAVGGHPMSVLFTVELFRNLSVSEIDLEELQSKGVETTRDWLLARVFNHLTEIEQEVVLVTSVFTYPFEDEEFEQLLSTTLRPRYLFNSLMKKHLVAEVGNGYVVHDAIRSLAYDMLSSIKKGELHRKIADYYREKLEKEYQLTEEASYDIGYKWCYHLERVASFRDSEKMIYRLLNLNNNCLSALLAIKQYGYPYDFNDQNLMESEEVINYLLGESLVEKNLDEADLNTESAAEPKEFNIKGFEFFDELLLFCICSIKDIGGHTGYFNFSKPNYAFNKQGLLCPWEHCIELYPLLAGRDTNLQSCPIFGHCCPGGEMQAQICKDNSKDYFIWAPSS